MSHRNELSFAPRMLSATDHVSGQTSGQASGRGLAFAVPGGVALALAVLMGAACGGDGKDADEPELKPEPGIFADDSDRDDGPEEVQITGEQFDSIKRYFERKNKFLNTCFTTAITAGEISKRGGARIAVTVTVTRAGKIRSPKVTGMKPESATLRDCIFEKMQRWQLTTLPKPFDYSHTFGFATL